MIDIKNLTFCYDKKIILNDISLNVKQGKICGILGPNGSGKSTFFKCILKILKPNSSQIFINNININTLNPSKIAKLISYVAQQNDISFNFTAYEVVLMGISPSLGGVFGISKKDKDFVLKMIEKVGMKGFENYDFNSLSGGQKQLILIARALVMQTPVIILDEPTSALDLNNTLCIWNIINELSKEGKTILVCTHEPNYAIWFCDNVAIFYQGKILKYGKSDEVLTQDTIDTIYKNDFTISNIPQIKGKIASIIHPVLDK